MVDSPLADLWPLLARPVCPVCREERAPKRGMICTACSAQHGGVPLAPYDPLLSMPAEVLREIGERWEEPSTEAWRRHIELMIAHARRRGHRPGMPSPVEPGKPVPGCTCPECAPVRDTPAARLLARIESGRGRGSRSHGKAGAPRSHLDVEAARAVPLVDVLARLGVRLPRQTGPRFRVPCPAHRGEGLNCAIDTGRGLWKCHVCHEGGDAIRMVERARGCRFADAVRFILGGTA